uniref:Uncharacterized protein n=1 Tax=Ananas comosus var. bracteatus TaxID=296719 RepID=A0A6V7Q435_ANACO|nr:unnamed protein product [Ananas comosus var. bracteatus]
MSPSPSPPLPTSPPPVTPSTPARAKLPSPTHIAEICLHTLLGSAHQCHSGVGLCASALVSICPDWTCYPQIKPSPSTAAAADLDCGKGNANQDAWKWVDELEVYKEYWAWAFDRGRRFGLMTTNMSESLNRVLKGIRAIPITAFVAGTFYKLNSYFSKRRENGNLDRGRRRGRGRA